MRIASLILPVLLTLSTSAVWADSPDNMYIAWARVANENTPVYGAMSTIANNISRYSPKYRLSIVSLCHASEPTLQPEMVAPALHKSAENGNLDNVRQLLTSSDVNAVDAQGATALEYALAYAPMISDSGDFAPSIVALLLQKNAQCGHTPANGALRLACAAIGGYSSEQLNTLLASTPNVDTRLTNGLTPFLWAAALGTPDAVNTLVRHGANLWQTTPGDRSGSEGEIALHLAARFNPNPEVAQALIALKQDINKPSPITVSQTPLMLACDNNPNLKVATLLMDAGANINAQDDVFYTAFMYAARRPGASDLLRTLVARGADPLSKTDNGSTALHTAAALNGDPEVIRTLLALGLAINAPTLDGYGNETPLMFAVRRNPNPDIIRLLLENGADTTLRNEEGLRVGEGLSWERAEWLNQNGLDQLLRTERASKKTSRTAPASWTPRLPMLRLHSALSRKNSGETLINMQSLWFRRM